MKLVTYQPLGTNDFKTGIWLDRDHVLDIATEARARGVQLDATNMLALIDGGAATLDTLRAFEASPQSAPVLMNTIVLKAPIPRPRKNVFCVGWNYLEHFTEGATTLQDGREIPKWPVFFSKAPTAVNGPYDPIPYDASVSTQLDWEVELAVVLGTRGKNIAEADAFSHVFGYTIANDVTWRDIQRRHGGQWDKGKSLDGTCPMGPCIVTADAIDPDDLDIRCTVSNVIKQASNTKHLFFKIPRLIHDLSLGQTLEPSDIILTGTPEGVGFARNPPEWMKPNDLLETEIAGIGVMRNPIGEF
jgi:2-keto-4-pentenoate hydratase/2-oxohepta-3-ene-1,7-dioic acid hydratase in catechol pathway